MDCPACGNNLNPYRVGSITLDVCAGGCGGIWFDAFELQKMDETNEPVPPDLLNLKKDAHVQTVATAKRRCPKCEGMIMGRHFFSAQKKVEVDSCPNCGGYWLDAGELAAVRNETEAQKQRKRATETKLTRLTLQALSKNLAACREEVQSQPGLAHRLQVMSASVQTVAASIQR
jgi:uncharacterized protein